MSDEVNIQRIEKATKDLSVANMWYFSKNLPVRAKDEVTNQYNILSVYPRCDDPNRNEYNH
jgi:hypothetical protein